MANQVTNVSNSFESTLSSSLGAGDTTINVTSTDGTPGVPFFVVIDPADDSKREVVLVDSGKTGNTFTLSSAAQRGQDGTTDVAHDANAVIGIYPIAAHWGDINDRVSQHAHGGGTDGAAVATSDLSGHDKATHDALGLDHGSLSGRTDDDHTQYLNEARHDLTARHGSAVVDHGSIGGLGDDDHAQYLNTARHDVTARHPISVLGDGNGLGLRQVVTFTTSGTFSKGDYPWARAIRVEGVAGGGAGAGAAATSSGECSVGAGGGAGSWSRTPLIPVSSLASSETVTVGSGGTGSTGNGGNGGASSFGSWLTTNGGLGGVTIGAGTSLVAIRGNPGGAEGSSSGGVSSQGQPGTHGLRIVGTGGAGSGGASHYSGGGFGTSNTDGNGGSGRWGSGGGGANNRESQFARPGGAGGDGLIIVEIYA